MAKTNQLTISKIGQLPVVILPLKDYEQMKEDLEMLHSKKLAKDIEASRKQKKIIPLKSILEKEGLI
jgi:PHD/YefM family antitoxin component YafN of YafNO toxin-antitoxin module